MGNVIFEDRIRYEPWIKALLVFSILLLLGLGILFSVDAWGTDLIRSSPPGKSAVGAAVLWGTVPLMLVIFAFLLPRRIVVLSDGLRIDFLPFRWTLPFSGIESVRAGGRIMLFWGFSSITSYRNRVDIRRSNGWDVLISPEHADLFVAEANGALEEWTQSH
jgi:hypothetical protein